MKVKICTENIVEVRYTILTSFLERESLVINNKWITKPTFSVAESASEVVISTAKLKVKINKSNQSVTYTDLKGNVILSEDKSNSKKMV
jgi:alpha-D-xyloside xylohydrolase